MKFSCVYFGYDVELEPETLSKVMLLGFSLWQAADEEWHFTDARGDVQFAGTRKNGHGIGYSSPQEAAIAGIKYYTAGNKP